MGTSKEKEWELSVDADVFGYTEPLSENESLTSDKILNQPKQNIIKVKKNVI